MMDSFESYLDKVRKPNGDKLLPVTKENYLYYINSISVMADKLGGPHDRSNHVWILARMNANLKDSINRVMYYAYRSYLKFLGYHTDDKIFRLLIKPPKSATALSSKRFLESKVLSKGELKRLFNEANDDEMRMLFSFLYDTAARRNELLNIKYSDIVFKDPADSENNNIYAEVHILGKGALGRTVYLGKTSTELLKKLRPNIKNDEYIFEFYNGDDPVKYQGDYLNNLIKKEVSRILDRHITTHCFRHTRLTHMADMGADLLLISRYAGHSDFASTKVYIEISKFQGRMAFSRFSQDISEVAT